MPASHPRPSVSPGAHSVAGVGHPGPQMHVLPVSAIRTTPQNPRSAPDTALDDLVASLSVETEPYLAQPPLVEQLGGSDYRVIAGERRMRAVAAAGWERVACVVYPKLDPAHTHELRLIENLHRQALNAIDEASAIKIAFLVANADALGVGGAARDILALEQATSETITHLMAVLDSTTFAQTRPAVPWNQVLDTLGLDLSPGQRKRRLRLLTLDGDVQVQARTLQLSEAGMRALGTLEPEQQQRLLREMTDEPKLVKKVRRIASTVKKGTYTLDEALDEARGRVRLAPSLAPAGETWDYTDDDVEQRAATPSSSGVCEAPAETDQALQNAVMEVLNLASQVTAAAAALKTALGSRAIADLGEPWSGYAGYAITLIREATHELPAQP